MSCYPRILCVVFVLLWGKPTSSLSIGDPILSGRKAIPPQGTAGIDFPTYADVPQTDFKCEQQEIIGYYADVESQCQAFHICMVDGSGASFLCPNETLFHQRLMVCDWWYNVNCTEAPEYYPVNSRIYNNTRILSSNQGFRPDENPTTTTTQASTSAAPASGASDDKVIEDEDEGTKESSSEEEGIEGNDGEEAPNKNQPARDSPSLDWVPVNEDFEHPGEGIVRSRTSRPRLGGPKPMTSVKSDPHKEPRRLIVRKPVRPVPISFEDHFF